jgi:glycine C-acetyltransferase
MVGDSRLARKLADTMFDLKVFVLPIVYPMVAKDRARIRTIVTSAHSKRDLDFALDAFNRAGKKLGFV